ncbi:MAL-like protein isoform X2 [Protopterus annectens]|uniref:MAL-like protein isoform X2 n=1 Tax=Protopterus annectens TaxID=7888 RepID=UPI001CFA98E7|nr:MAL-like protein isoform X2 [Protopterus annectens]
MSNIYSTVHELPSGLDVFRNIPDAFIVPELVFGGWVWILVAATKVSNQMNQGWVMFVSVTLFLFSLILLFVYLFGIHKTSSAIWTAVDAIYHGISAVLYFSAAVLQANATVAIQSSNDVNYKLDVAATVFSFVVTLLYVVHGFFSFRRWRS